MDDAALNRAIGMNNVESVNVIRQKQ